MSRPKILDRHADHHLIVRCVTCTHTLDLPAAWLHDRLVADPVSDQLVTTELGDAVPQPGETIGQARARRLREQRAEALSRATPPEQVPARVAALRAAYAEAKARRQA